MIVAHIESGLGNQMLDYVDYLILKKKNPQVECYYEDIIYQVNQDAVSMWNGFELNDIFQLEGEKLSTQFSPEAWERIVRSVEDSRFWVNSWDFAPSYIQAFQKEGLNLKNDCIARSGWKEQPGLKTSVKKISKKIGGRFYCYLRDCKKEKNFLSTKAVVIPEYAEDVFAGHTLSFMNRKNGMEEYEDYIRSVFRFPEFTDEKNIACARKLQNEESVAIHARRGDMLNHNGDFYKYGYFKKAVGYIKKKVKNPVFYFFCDTGSIEWCKENEKIFGLDFSKDKVFFVDWNSSKDSYRDMQLMSLCKHNIVTISSFGWWGAFMNQNAHKITISPEPRINTNVNIYKGKVHEISNI